MLRLPWALWIMIRKNTKTAEVGHLRDLCRNRTKGDESHAFLLKHAFGSAIYTEMSSNYWKFEVWELGKILGHREENRSSTYI